MKKSQGVLFIMLFLSGMVVHGQETLPRISVKNINGKIIVSWTHDFTKPLANIHIQRSYDSTRNFSTIGSVLNPNNKENGFPDLNPPYNKMYYRVSVSFEGGTYVIGPSARPVKEIPPPVEVPSGDTTLVKIPGINPGTIQPNQPFQSNPLDSMVIIPPKRENEITYPSSRIYTTRFNSVVIYLPLASIKKYAVKFYDENDQFLFELNKLNEEYLILEKVNFVHSGWFRFELFEDGKLIEKNKFYIGKDGKQQGNK